MFPLPQAKTTGMRLEEVLTRLSQNEFVNALVTVGSTAKGSLTPVSDYDILIVLEEMPVPLHVGITYIDHRLTDLLFATTTQVRQILEADSPIDADHWVGRIARWLTTGRIEFDRHGLLQLAQAKVSSKDWIRALEPIDTYASWIGVNYNLLHTRRLMASNDPVHIHAAELRMAMYGMIMLVPSYFRIRNLLWEGDKAAVRHLMAHDPAYFDLLQRFLREGDPYRKFTLYEELASATLEPTHHLWDGEPTVLWSDALPATWQTVEEGLTFWDALLGAAST